MQQIQISLPLDSEQALAAQIKLVNFVHSEFNRLAPLFKANFKLFHEQGKKVFKADGTLTEAFKNTIPVLPPGLFIHFPSPGCVEVMGRISGNSFLSESDAHKAYFYFATKDSSGQRVPYMDLSPLPADFTLEKVIDAKRRKQGAEEVLRKIDNEKENIYFKRSF